MPWHTTPNAALYSYINSTRHLQDNHHDHYSALAPANRLQGRCETDHGQPDASVPFVSRLHRYVFYYASSTIHIDWSYLSLCSLEGWITGSPLQVDK